MTFRRWSTPSDTSTAFPNVKEPVSHPYELVFDTLGNAQQRANISSKRFRPRLQAFKDYAFDHRTFGLAQVAEQIRVASDFGSDGWMLWNPHNRYQGLGLEVHEPAKKG